MTRVTGPVTGPVTVVLPAHLRTLARSGSTVVVTPAAPTLAAVLDALEAAHPALLGTIRDRRSGRRRDYVRFFACERDLSHDPSDVELPAAVLTGLEPLLVVGAMAGG